MADVLNKALWQFNEAVSLLTEVMDHVDPLHYDLVNEIEEGLPAIREALQDFAAHQTAQRDGAS